LSLRNMLCEVTARWSYLLPATAPVTALARFSDSDHVSALPRFVRYVVDHNVAEPREIFVQLAVNVSGDVIGIELLETVH
jgi:hypothetical protein